MGVHKVVWGESSLYIEIYLMKVVLQCGRVPDAVECHFYNRIVASRT
jgi:hypothetical protein